MDDPALDPQSHRHALRSLARINVLSRSANTLWPTLKRFCDEHAGRPVRVLDIACGGGDLPLEVNRRARDAGCDLTVDGCDVSPLAVQVAQETNRDDPSGAKFFRLDALRDELPDGYDVAITSMFTHHLEREDVVELLRRMSAKTRLVIVNDLVRSWYGWLGVKAVVHMVSRSPVVHVDGPRSIRASFTVEEMRAIAEEAGLSGCAIAWRPPVRMLLTWRPT